MDPEDCLHAAKAAWKRMREPVGPKAEDVELRARDQQTVRQAMWQLGRIHGHYKARRMIYGKE